MWVICMKTGIIILVLSMQLAVVVMAGAREAVVLSSGHGDVGRLPGVGLAQGISEITGAAVSPLLGVSVVGAWRYFRTDEEMRGGLPWFCQPLFWGFGFSVLVLVLLKDSVGAVLPGLLKKPFDMAELFEDKLSAMVVGGAFVPIIAMEVARGYGGGGGSGDAGVGVELMAASILPVADVGMEMWWLFVPLAVLAFFVVWLSSHTINVLIAISPFGIVDVVLKLVKAGLLALVVLAYVVHPYIGGLVSFVLIVVAGYVAPAAFRFSVFGTLIAVDVILPWRGKRRVTPESVHAFMGTRALGIPARTYGRFERAMDGSIAFTYRAWLVGRKRGIPLPARMLSIEKGTIFPSLLRVSGSGGKDLRLLYFLPRYRGEEGAIAGHFGIFEIRETRVVKGYHAIRRWFSSMANLGRQKGVQAG